MPYGPHASVTQVIAHRGASRQCRENTVEAFRRAREVGADAVELDVRRTADGVLVVHHDPVLADGRSVASILASAVPSYVPTLGEALDACDGMWVNVEVKNDPDDEGFDPTDSIAEQTAALLSARPDPGERWLVSSFRRQSVDAVRRMTPQIPTAWLCLEVPLVEVPGLAADGHVAVHPWVEMVTDETIARCHEAGLSVNVWTCDDPHRMSALLTAGVDGLCTNLPDLARQVVDAGTTRRTTSGS